MRLYLSRGRENRYMLTRLLPVRAKLRGTDLEDLYFWPGDPMAIMNLCAASARGLFDVELEPFNTVVVTLEGETTGEPEELERVD